MVVGCGDGVMVVLGLVWGVVRPWQAALDQLSETPSGHTHILGLARIHLHTFESMTAAPRFSPRPLLWTNIYLIHKLCGSGHHIYAVNESDTFCCVMCQCVVQQARCFGSQCVPKAGKRTKMATLARDLGDYVLRAPPGGSGSQS